MFVVTYSYKIKPNKDAEFHQAWHDLIEQMYVHSGSLGARLHKSQEYDYIGYTQWPDKKTWQEAESKIPRKYKHVIRDFQEITLKINKMYEADVVADLLMPRTFSL